MKIRSYQVHALTHVLRVTIALFSIGLIFGLPNEALQGQSKTDSLESQLKLAGPNRPELELALKEVPGDQLAGLQFLISNMPEDDLKNLTADFLLTNVDLAYQARDKAVWKLSDDLFFNYVLPYANIDEPRDPWRSEMMKICDELVSDCQTPGEAAQRLNEKLFGIINVKYSTKRKRANQSPKESIEQGLASCTGLSIILVDACRSVGVPARLAGIPSWKNKRGNHTWVEVWDQQWHFTGAAEPNDQGLNHTWFQNDAALADPESKKHSIYAVSFAQTDTLFPMVWSPGKRVFAENVTRRYLQQNLTGSDKIKVMIRAWNQGKTERKVVAVEVECQRCQDSFTGFTKAGTHDMNDMLTFELDPNSGYQVKIKNEHGKLLTKIDLKTESGSNQLVELEIGNNISDDQTDLTEAEKATLIKIADQKFSDAKLADQALLKNPNAVRQIAWERYLNSEMAQKQKSDFEQNQVSTQTHRSPYTIKEVGVRPEGGWPLFIAMHGGGGVAKKFNDSQWRHMQIYYKDQKDLTGYKYLALRAPTDEWNGFYTDYVYPLIENLVRQFIVFGDINPDKVFIMGYSHGGYGAFAIGPKIPYRFAAVHASAAAPTGGETTAKTLRNTRFTFMVGEKDTAYGRAERCQKFAAEIEQLQKDHPGDYPVEFMFKRGFGHGGLPDRDMISLMYDHTRVACPRHLTWEMTDPVVRQFYWLKCDQPNKGQMIDAAIEDNVVEVTTQGCNSFSILLDKRLIDPDKPLVLKVDGSESQVKYQPSFDTLCQSIAATGDPSLAYDFEIKVVVNQSESQ
ncbi:MAG: transglutaminase domain-containing protein [Planctomycetota bacterium]